MQITWGALTAFVDCHTGVIHTSHVVSQNRACGNVLAGDDARGQVRQRVERTRGDLRVHLVLHLTCDADPGRREVTLDPVFRCLRACCLMMEEQRCTCHAGEACAASRCRWHAAPVKECVCSYAEVNFTCHGLAG